jgi:exonuclease SbcC
MISSLRIINYQSHKHSPLDFHPGVNVIIGPSDAGKSSILRALRWLITNRPLGDDFRSNWGGNVNVKVETEEGYKISRTKSKSFNGYILNDGDKSLTFEAIKTDVPKEIQDALNISEINLQQQADPFFLISKSPGEVAKFFNKIANLDKIDQGISNVKKWIGQINSTISFTQGELAKAETNIAQYDYLEKFEIDLEVLEGMEAQLNVKYGKAEKLAELISDIQSVDKNIAECGGILKIEVPLNNIFELIDLRDKKIETANSLQKLIDSVNDLEENISKYDSLIEIEPDVIKLLKSHEELNAMQTEYDKLKKLYNSIIQIDQRIALADKNYKQLHKELDENTPDECPFCGTKIK